MARWLMSLFAVSILLSAVGLSAGETIGDAERSLDRYAREDIDDWRSGRRPSCSVPLYRYFIGIEMVYDIRYRNCLDLEYLITDEMPADIHRAKDAQALIVPGAALDISAVSRFSNLQHLHVYTRDHAGYRPIDFTPLASLENLEHLHINVEDFFGPDALDPIENLSTLRILEIIGWSYPDITALSNLTNLENLLIKPNYNDIGGVISINALANLTNLKKLDFNQSDTLVDVSALENMRKLKELNLSDTDVADISALSHLKRLVYLNLDNTRIRNIDALRNKLNLVSLSLSGTMVTDLSSLGGARRLKFLDLSGVQFDSLAPLTGLSRLEVLFLSDWDGSPDTELIDLAPLLNLRSLKEIIVNPAQVNPAQMAAFKRKGVTVGLGEIIYD